MGPRTKVVIVNSPHNPTGKVFSRAELQGIANLCCKFDCLAISDEVYEHITFDSAEHVSLASLSEMRQRTIVTSSVSKTFSVTGWRVGWAIAPAEISAAISNIHVKLTDSAPAPFQEAALVALDQPPFFYQKLKQDYMGRRDFVCGMLSELGFKNYLVPQGSFFVFAELPQSCKLNDVEFSAHLIQTAGVAIVPGRGFFHLQVDSNGEGDGSASHCKSESIPHCHRYVRIAFCKHLTTLHEARNALFDCVEMLKLQN
eukprot:TRINITY_DN9727_c0_g1_i1.p1 TRINITY_DN9727_c0_g1~~TRINITY_DN9727_c0_g1_i1.p1  ORF type:complete len:281 (+),score=34.95 TRINITY_DN9727_c0_g1_i1:75-845(+)